MNSNKSISILGCGWLGFELAKTFIQDGYRVKGSSTTLAKIPKLESEGIDSYLIDLNLPNALNKDFFQSDVLIINIPPGRRDPNVSANYPKKIQKALQVAKNVNVKQVILVSSTGVYASGQTSSNNLQFPIYTTEPPNAISSSARGLIRSESILQEVFPDKGIVLRFGGLVGGDRIAGRFLSGKKDLHNGMAPVNMIHRDDCIAIIRKIITDSYQGLILNATTDEHPSRADFYIHQLRNMEWNRPHSLKRSF